MLLTISYSDRLTRFTYENLWKNTFLCKLYIFILVVYKTKIVVMFFSFLYSGSAYPITIWQSLITHFYGNYLFWIFLVVNKNKNSYYIFNILIFRISLHYYHMTIFENIFLCKLLICCLYSRKQQKRLLECR